MSLTFLQLAEIVLAEQNRALSVDEIWQLALEADYVAQLNSRVRQQIPIFPVFAYPASTKSSTCS